MTEVTYEKCADCPLFIEEIEAPHALYMHLHRGDEADEALNRSHEPRPSGMLATLNVWKAYGPMEMRLRFDRR